MDMVHKIEDRLADLCKNAPNLPLKTRKALAEYWPWITLVTGILQLWAVFALWGLRNLANSVIDYANNLSRALGGTNVAPKIGLFFWVSLLILLADAVLILAAFPALKEKKKEGWDLLFLAGLVNLVYGLAQVFNDSRYGGGVSRLFWSIISSAIGFWLLFQLRSQFSSETHKHPHKKSEK
jgi:uncharacterized membrane protein HdeD (DUF308 family)